MEMLLLFVGGFILMLVFALVKRGTNLSKSIYGTVWINSGLEESLHNTSCYEFMPPGSFQFQQIFPSSRLAKNIDESDVIIDILWFAKDVTHFGKQNVPLFDMNTSKQFYSDGSRPVVICCNIFIKDRRSGKEITTRYIEGGMPPDKVTGSASFRYGPTPIEAVKSSLKYIQFSDDAPVAK
jgi:hypothetical protein